MHHTSIQQDPVVNSGMLKRALNWLESDVANQTINHAFEANLKSGDQKILSVCVPVEVSDPLAVLELIPKDDEFQYYWERPVDQFAVAAHGKCESFQASGIQRFEMVQQWVNLVKKNHYRASMIKHRHANLAMFGGFGFFDQNNAKEWEGFDAAHFVIPEWCIIRDGQLRVVVINIKIVQGDFADVNALKSTVISKLSSLFGMLEAHRKQMRDFREDDNIIEPKDEVVQPLKVEEQPAEFSKWVAHIDQAKEMINKGYFEKIVIARNVHIQTEKAIRLTRVANALRRTYPECTSYFVGFGNGKHLIGSTPEVLASFKPNYILTEALAGTMKRGKTASEDAMYEQKLLDSTKDREEHKYVVDAIKHQLSRFVHQVDIAHEPTIKKLNNVQHLYTPITAWKDRPVHTMSVIHAMHPTPAVGGSPNGKAVKYIKQFEEFDRGWYAAPLGWMNLSDEAEFHVAIRSALVQNNEAFLFAGCGIVAESDPELEWKEANLKLIPMLTALKDA
jgi:menaquinone-specific isochorismate synthase